MHNRPNVEPPVPSVIFCLRSWVREGISVVCLLCAMKMLVSKATTAGLVSVFSCHRISRRLLTFSPLRYNNSIQFIVLARHSPLIIITWREVLCCKPLKQTIEGPRGGQMPFETGSNF
jgi:hypothetical protein